MPPYRYDTPSNPHVMSIAESLARRGDIAAQRALSVANAQAQAQQARGQIWGNAVQNIGQTVGNAVQSYMREREVAPQRAYEQARMDEDMGRMRRDAAIRDVGVKTQGNPEAYAREVALIDPERGMALGDQLSRQRSAAIAALGQRVNQHKTIFGQATQLLHEVERAPEYYTEVRPKLMELASALDPALVNEIPEQYDPARVRGMLQFTVGGAEQADKRARGLASLEAAEQAVDDAVTRNTKRVEGLADWFETAASPDEERQIADTATQMGIPSGVVANAQHRARLARDKQAVEQWTGGNSEYATYLRRWARDRGIPIQSMTAQHELAARRGFFEAGREPNATRAGADDPRFPRGVENYIAGMKGRGYTRAQAESEVFADQTWRELQRAHPRVSAIDVQQAINRLFPEFDGTGNGGSVFGAEPDAAATSRGAAGGPGPRVGADGQPAGQRTATADDVRGVARQMGISEADARRRLEAQGVVIR